jgi:hypothetical protein
MLTETESIIALVYVIFALSSIHWIMGVKFDEYYKKIQKPINSLILGIG